MTAHLTEQEQMEAFKRWWKENGRSTLVLVIVCVGLFLGWQSWKSSKQASAEAASATFQQLMQASAVNTSDSQTTASHLANTLKQEYSGSLYAAQAALWLAKAAVDKQDYEAAVAELEWVLQQDMDGSLAHLARIRLARVLLAQGKIEAADKTLQVEAQGAFVAGYAEAEGDVLVARGQLDAAATAYQKALDTLSNDAVSHRQIIEMKLIEAKNPLTGKSES